MGKFFVGTELEELRDCIPTHIEVHSVNSSASFQAGTRVCNGFWSVGMKSHGWIDRNGQLVVCYNCLGVSKNRGTPKWMVYNESLLRWMIWGYHNFRKHRFCNTISSDPASTKEPHICCVWKQWASQKKRVSLQNHQTCATCGKNVAHLLNNC